MHKAGYIDIEGGHSIYKNSLNYRKKENTFIGLQIKVDDLIHLNTYI